MDNTQQQPEALRLADEVDGRMVPTYWEKCAAAELRRQHAEIDRLRADAARQNKLMHLASQDEVFFGGFIYDPDDREFSVPPPLVLCSDFFAPAADCDELPASEIDALHDAYLRFGHAGVLAWVSIRRGNAQPWRLKPESEYVVAFEAARAALSGGAP